MGAVNTKNKAFSLEGSWTLAHIQSLEDTLRLQGYRPGEKSVVLDARGLQDIDTAGAWLIDKYFPAATFSFAPQPRHQALLDFTGDLPEHLPQKKTRLSFYQAVSRIGETVAGHARFIYKFVSFIGRAFTRLLRNIAHPSRFRIASITRHIREMGWSALPIIGLLAFGISTVIFYQGATQLQKFGADVYTIDLTVISLLREMAVLMTAIMVAGRSGSAMAAEIGVMKLRGEIDALQTMGVDPIEALVVPRLIAMMIALPILGFFAGIMGLIGGGIMSMTMLDISVMRYIDRVQDTATPLMFFIGMIKAPVFALLITSICTYQGMQVKNSAEQAGKLTTLAVVQSIFLVIMADAVFSIVFSWMGL